MAAQIAGNRRFVPIVLVLAGAMLMALGTVGLRILLAVLAPVGVQTGTHDALIGSMMLWLVGGGVLCIAIGLILAMAHSGASRAAWLIGSGVTLFCLGCGPLLVVMLAAWLGLTADRNPNPIFLGMLFAATFTPAIVLVICGVVARFGQAGGRRTQSATELH
jgi:hypothetical protein